jgi:hypothetical protein
MASARVQWTVCPECRDETAFEQPPCADGHGDQCPEWFCVTCGYALIEGEVQVIALLEHTSARPEPAALRSTRSA